ncbi:MAG: tRNA adenosine(34) deaminase TadA [Desulfobacteraceae bacterium]|nr:MAG: tRNA adenosine(34) deaminase TadA [Desulfobacteraceae bacterium]
MLRDDQYFMNLALKQALRAQAQGEVPVGAVLVDAEKRILAKAHNQTIGRCDPSAHAEMTALRKGARKLGNYRLLSTTLYVTIEPCVMCMGAIVHSRVARLVFGAHDPKWGAAGSLYDLTRDNRLNHRPQILAGVQLEACRAIMRRFFQSRRGQPDRLPDDNGIPRSGDSCKAK